MERFRNQGVMRPWIDFQGYLRTFFFEKRFIPCLQDISGTRNHLDKSKVTVFKVAFQWYLYEKIRVW